MRILIFGSRDWTDQKAIRREMMKCQPGSTLIHGNCRGADRLAAEIAEEMGWKIEVFRADWDGQGLAAGPIRNQRMIDDGKPDLALGFHPDIVNSKGSGDMARRLFEANIYHVIFKR